jgi:uncharacterized protein (DUF433 family)
MTESGEPTVEHPHRIELCWTPDQNFGAVVTYPRRCPVTAIVSRLRGGEDAELVALDYDLTVEQVWLLGRLGDDLISEDDDAD